jgi:hypothetical protein
MATLNTNAPPAWNRLFSCGSRHTQTFGGIEVSVIAAAALLWAVLAVN